MNSRNDHKKRLRLLAGQALIASVGGRKLTAKKKKTTCVGNKTTPPVVDVDC